MEATEVSIQMTLCDSPLPALEVPTINMMVTCLGSEHRKLGDHISRLAFAATRLPSRLLKNSSPIGSTARLASV